MADPISDPRRTSRRRRRLPVSCSECRRRKQRCDRLAPCNQCVKAKRTQSCHYTPSSPAPADRDDASVSSGRAGAGAGGLAVRAGQQQHRHGATTIERRSHAPGMFVFDSMSMNNNNNNPPPEDESSRKESLKLGNIMDRIQTATTTSAHPESSSKPRDRGNDINSSPYLPDICFRRKNAKTKFFGRCHWAVTMSLFKDVRVFLDHVHKQKERHSELSEFSEYKKMKRLKAEIASREKEEYLIPAHLQAFRLEELVPDRQLADQLLNLYLSTFETTYRVLHVPKFLDEYNAFWAGEKPDAVFVAKLLVALASGSCFYHGSGNTDPSLAKTSQGWALAVHSWASSTMKKERMNMHTIQVQCLLLIADQAIGFECDLGWISCGALVRNAMMIGLHRDPCHFSRVSKYYAEIRRRLWTTIVELDMQAALGNGMLPSISLDECDSALPVNVDDEQLSEKMVDDPVPFSLAERFTRTSFQLVLARSLPVRMRIAKLVNSLKFDLSYDEALKLTEDLIQQLHDMPPYFRDSEQGRPPPNVPKDSFTFEISLLRLQIYRCLLILHRPFALGAVSGQGGQERFMYSRKVCVESCLAILAPLMSLPEEVGPHCSSQILHLKGSMFGDEVFHAGLTLCLELKAAIADIALPALPYSSSYSTGTSNLTSFGNITNSHRETMFRAVECTIDHFARKIQRDRHGSKMFLFLYMALASARRLISEPDSDPISFFQESCLRAVMHCKALLSGASWRDIKDNSGNQRSQLPTPGTETLSRGSNMGMQGEGPETSSTLSFDGNFSDFDLSAFLDIPDLGFFDPGDLGMV